MVSVYDRNGNTLPMCHEAIARGLLRSYKAKVVSAANGATSIILLDDADRYLSLLSHEGRRDARGSRHD